MIDALNSASEAVIIGINEAVSFGKLPSAEL